MNEAAARHISSGMMWFGFWLMIGLANFGEQPISKAINKIECATSDVSLQPPPAEGD